MAPEWSVREEGGAMIVSLDRELDPDGLRSLEEVLSPLLVAPKARVVVDLAACPSVNSEVLRLFLAVARRLESQGGGFALAAPNAEVKRFLELSGVGKLCRVLPTVAEAVEALRGNERIEALAAAVLALLVRAEQREGAYGL